MKTDPEPDMGGEQITARNMRSKCRCSYVLQFAFRRAVCCVLHRPPSQVIHCIVLFFQNFTTRSRSIVKKKTLALFTSHHGEGSVQIHAKAKVLLQLLLSPRAVNGALHPCTDHRRAKGATKPRHCRTRRSSGCRQAAARRPPN